jgi:MOSC domain-containing protein YiiM
VQGHGGVNRAVFVYQLESYRYWQLRRFGHDHEPATADQTPISMA